MLNRLQIIGQNIRDLRKQRKTSQIELAIEIEIDRSYLSEIENGKANLSVNVLYAIADAFGVDITDLFVEK